MNLNNIDLSKTKITTHNEGKALLISRLLDQINFNGVINDNLTSSSGRNPGISYGTVGKMMIVTMSDDHHPLCGGSGRTISKINCVIAVFSMTTSGFRFDRNKHNFIEKTSINKLEIIIAVSV